MSDNSGVAGEIQRLSPKSMSIRCACSGCPEYFRSTSRSKMTTVDFVRQMKFEGFRRSKIRKLWVGPNCVKLRQHTLI